MSFIIYSCLLLPHWFAFIVLVQIMAIYLFFWHVTWLSCFVDVWWLMSLMCVYVKKTSALLILDSRSIVKNKLSELNLVFICALIVPWLGLPNGWGWGRRGLQPACQTDDRWGHRSAAPVPLCSTTLDTGTIGTSAIVTTTTNVGLCTGCRPLRSQPFGSPSQGTMSAQINTKFNSVNLFFTILRESKIKSTLVFFYVNTHQPHHTVCIAVNLASIKLNKYFLIEHTSRLIWTSNNFVLFLPRPAAHLGQPYITVD